MAYEFDPYDRLLSPYTETVCHDLDGRFFLDSFFQAGYGYAREQAKGSLLGKVMRMPVQAEGVPGFQSAR